MAVLTFCGRLPQNGISEANPKNPFLELYKLLPSDAHVWQHRSQSQTSFTVHLKRHSFQLRPR